MKKCTLLLTLLAASVVSACSTMTARAGVVDLRSLVSADANLIHHYTFEGPTDLQRREDKQGSADLSEVSYGSPGPITYDAAGFDGTTKGVITTRNVGDTDNGRGLSTGSNISLPTALTVELLMRPDAATLSGPTKNGYVAMTRAGGSQRGYYVFQGSYSTTDSNDIATLIGSGYDAGHEQTLVETLTAGHWYYVANTYSVSGGNTTINTHIADLTAGDTTLTTATKGVTGTYGSVAPLGIGIADFTLTSPTPPIQSAFPGAIDEVALYNSALNAAALQNHLDTLLGTAGPVPDELRLDFGTTTGDDQTGYNPFERGSGGTSSTSSPQSQSFLSGLGTGDMVTVSLGAVDGNLQWRDRGDVTNHPQGDLLEDLVAGVFGGGSGGDLRLTLSDLEAGLYEITTYHHDPLTIEGRIDIDVDDALGTHPDVVTGLLQSAGYDNPSLAEATYQFLANGTDDIVITFDQTGYPGHQYGTPAAVLSGLTLTVIPEPVPEPGTLALLATAVLAWLPWARRRKRR